MMNQHKMLTAAAMAAAFSIGGGGTVWAADPTFELTSPATTTPTVAVELFKSNNAQLLPEGGTFGAKYTLALDADINKAFYVYFTLSTGEWNGTLGISNLVIGSWPVGSIDLTYLGEETPGTQKYVIRAADQVVLKADTLTFQDFQLKGLAGLTEQGIQVDLTIRLEYADDSGVVSASKTVTLVKSGVGAVVDYSTGDDNNVKIDVAQGGAKFVNGKYQSSNGTAASLGTIAISYPGTPVQDYSLTTDWNFADTNNGVNNGTLTINNGPFAASTAHGTGTPVKNLVFIDLDDPGTCNASGNNIPATKVNTTTTATWSLTAAQLDQIFNAPTKIARKICVLVADNNTTEINVPENAPTVSLTINYKKHAGIKYPGNLRQITRNGVICTLYNVPDNERQDVGSVRIINRSTNLGGSELIGSLRDSSGNFVFRNEVLFDGAKITPNQSFVLSSADLVELAKKAGHSGTWGRGPLTISSDLINMEVYGLVRNRAVDSPGSTLMNMSIPASGNGCGDK